LSTLFNKSLFPPVRPFWLLMILLCSAHPISTIASPNTSLYFDNLTRERGLVQSNIRAIEKDYNGYVWMGSSDGLYKWDGLSISIYREKTNDAQSLSDDNISSLYQDPDSSGLWIGTVFGGINYLNYSTGKFQSWMPAIKQGKSERYLNNIKTLSRVNDSIMLAGTHAQGLFLLTFSDGKLISTRQVKFRENSNNFRVYSIQKIRDKIYAGTSNGLFIFSEGGELDFFSGGFRKDGKLQSWFKDFTPLPDGSVLMATHNHLWHWNPDSLEATSFHTECSIPQITRISHLQNGELWVGTLNDGLFRIDTDTGNTEQYNISRSSEPEGRLVHNQINDLLFYQQQPILMAATPGGISSIDFERRLFQSYDLRKRSDAGNTSVFFLMQDSTNRFWFWSLAGLYRQTDPKGSFTKVLDTNFEKTQTIVRDGEQINNALWFGTSKGLLEIQMSNAETNMNRKSAKANSDIPKSEKSMNKIHRAFNPTNDSTTFSANDKRWHYFEHDSLSKVNLNNISSLWVDNQKNIWMASPEGVIIYDTTDDHYSVFPFPKATWGRSSIPVTDLVVNEDQKTCWIGSKSQYLFLLDTTTGKYKRIRAIAESHNKKTPIKTNYVLSLATDKKGNLWLATFGSGLLFLDRESLTIHDDFARSTIAGNTYAVVCDSDGNLWVSTDYGITKLTPSTGSLHEFGLDEGTFCQEFNERAVHQTRRGSILMGGTNGFVSFDPSNIHLNNYVPPVFISSYSIGNPNVTIGGQTFRDVNAIQKKHIEIPYGRENISFEVSVLNFRHPEKNQIAWKLENFDKAWSKAPASHIISYSNLPPGQYRLKVQGSNNHGIWNAEGDHIDITIKAPFYQKTWFNWVFGSFIILLIALVLWTRMRILRRQKILLSKMVREKTNNLRKANGELKVSQSKIMAQNQELELHRHDLEELVTIRTQDLEKEKKRAEESDRLKTAFLANLSHEIRTPMNAIVGFSTLLNNIEFSEEDKAGFIRMIQKSGDNLLALINDIIEISRIEAGQMALHPAYFKIGSFLDGIIKSLAFDPNNTNAVSLNLDVPEEIWDATIFADEQRLRQVISNLLSNALKFTSEGYVKLSVERFSGQDMLNFLPWFNPEGLPKQVLLFMIEDTGIGISEKNIKDIFIPFRKIEHSGETLYGGMGLGLSIVKSILTALGGDITLQSHPGQGTIFYFYMPDITISLDR
jgi:signal transduction histidine kinase/ligand-binding sensor domain-containing protein